MNNDLAPDLPARRIAGRLARVISDLEFDPPRGSITIEQLAERANVDRVAARHLASQLAKEGWFRRVKRGSYEFVSASSFYPSGSVWLLLAGIRQPHLVSGLTAARHHELTPQLPTRHLIVVDSDHRVPRPLLSPQFRITRLRPWRLGGAEFLDRDGVAVPFARVERVVLDAIEHPGWFGGVGETARIIRRGLPRASRDAIIELAQAWRSTSLLRRLGWWGDQTLEGGWGPEQRLALHTGQKPRVYVPLVPGEPARGMRDSEWGVIRNVSDEAIAMEATVR